MSHKEKIGEFTYHIVPFSAATNNVDSYNDGMKDVFIHTGHSNTLFLNPAHKNKFAFELSEENVVKINNFQKGIDLLDFRNINDVSCDDIVLTLSDEDSYITATSADKNSKVFFDSNDHITQEYMSSFTCDDFLFVNPKNALTPVIQKEEIGEFTYKIIPLPSLTHDLEYNIIPLPEVLNEMDCLASYYHYSYVLNRHSVTKDGFAYQGHADANTYFPNKNLKFAFEMSGENFVKIDNFRKGVDILDFRKINDVSCDDVIVDDHLLNRVYHDHANYNMNYKINALGSSLDIMILTDSREPLTCDDFLFATPTEDASVLADSVAVENFEVA